VTASDDPEAPFRARAMAALRAAFGVGGGPMDTFRRSMVLDYEKWHDGIGYDLGALAAIPASEHPALLSLLAPPKGWREIEALLALGTPAAIAALRTAGTSSDSIEVRIHVADKAPALLDGPTRIGILRDAIMSATFTDGLINALEQIKAFHPPPLREALLRGIDARDGSTSFHLAATLAHIHGAEGGASNPALQPLLLQFSTPDRAAKARALTSLYQFLGLADDGSPR
jgi:hypothetical protein